MELYNATKNNYIFQEVIKADTFLKRLKGLLGKKRLEDHQCLLIDPCKSVHTYFMKFPIDVVFLDKNYEVIKIINNLVPGKLSPYIKEAKMVLEISAYCSAKKGIEIGDVLVLQKEKIIV